MEKTCNCCGKTRPIEQFTPDKRKKLGYCNPCLDCGRLNATERMRRWRAANRDYHLEQRRQRYAENPTPHLERTQQWREANREYTREQARQWNANNVERKRAASLAWHKKNPEASRRAEKRYSVSHAKQIYQRARQWKKDHPERARETHRLAAERRRARKLKCAINDLTNEQWYEIVERYGHRCAYCGQRVEKLSQDHVLPISRGGNHTASNIVPACKSCNSRKHNRTPEQAGMMIRAPA